MLSSSKFSYPKSITFEGFIFYSSSRFSKMLDRLSDCETATFKNCIIHVDTDLMFKEDKGLDIGALIELHN